MIVSTMHEANDRAPTDIQAAACDMIRTCKYYRDELWPYPYLNEEVVHLFVRLVCSEERVHETLIKHYVESAVGVPVGKVC